MEKRDLDLNIEDYSGRNFDSDVLDTIVENSHEDHGETPGYSSDDILDEDHWANDSFDELKVEEEF